VELRDALDVLMFITVCVVLLFGFPVAFSLAGTALAFAMLAAALGVFDLAFLTAFPQRIYGTMTNEVLIAVPMFIFMGIMLERSKVAEDLLISMGRLFGTLRGGLGISMTLVGALLAASTGIVGATVVTMGLLSLPTMLNRGYNPAFATGSICAAGTLGQIIPPSIVLVLLGDILSSAYQRAQFAQGIFSPDTISVGDLFAGAMLPGLMLVGMYIVYQGLVAWLRPDAAPALPPDAFPEETDRELWARLLRALVPPILLIVAVLGSILGGVATPTEAASVGALGATLLAGLRVETRRRWLVYAAGASLIGLLLLTAFADLRLGRTVTDPVNTAGIVLAFVLCAVTVAGLALTLLRVHRAGVLFPVVRGTMTITTMVFVILIGATMFSLVFRGLGGDETVHEFLSGLPGGVVGAMVVVMLVMFVMGFFLDFIEITFVVVPIVAPILLMMGLDPVWLGVMMAINLQTSFLTPPFGFALFYLRGVAPPRVRTLDIYRGVMPFVAIQLIALLVLAWFPGIATWLPKQLF